MERQSKTLFGTGGLWAVASNVWRQLTRPPTVQEQNISESLPIEEPNAVPVQATQGTRAIQLPGDGDGATFHRRYRVQIAGSKFMASALVREVGLRFNQLSPSALAEFEKVKGKPWSLEVGDEFDIVILGPWNGSVRVCEVLPESFCFVTLEGHPEAGQIRFQASLLPGRRGAVSFEIVSWARSRDPLVALAYGAGGKEVQKSTWVQFLEAIVELSGGMQLGEITVETQKKPFEGEGNKNA
jgi:uncharacterized protein (UPF0548 family)